MGLVISISPEAVFHFGGLTITNSVLSTALVTLGIILFALTVSQKKRTLVPVGRSIQNVLEMIMELFMNFYSSMLGEHLAKSFFPFLTTIFFYILISSWSGLLPGVGSIGLWANHGGEMELIPLLRAPTADLNTTLALAVMAMIFIQWQGFKSLGVRYLGKFFTVKGGPIFSFVGILELMGEFTKIVSFAFRLFGNIFAGEVLLAVMSFLVPAIASIPFLGLEIFVGLVQSLVFVLLVMVFTKGAMAEHGDEHH